jgi:hypothetical protein
MAQMLDAAIVGLMRALMRSAIATVLSRTGATIASRRGVASLALPQLLAEAHEQVPREGWAVPWATAFEAWALRC